MVEPTKLCRRCAQAKPTSDFYPIKEKYLSAYCKPCVGLNAREWAKENPGKRQAILARNGERYRDTAWARAGMIREGMVQRTRKRGWPAITFTRSEILEAIEDGRCAKTGIPFDFTVPRVGQNPWTPVPDRIDSSKPYTHENVQWVCNMYNAAKQSWSDSEVELMFNAWKEHNGQA